MTISGFTMAKNATKLYFPIKESILSILPIVDEFIVALGDCDEDDKTRDEISSILSPKIKIIDTVWDTRKFPRSTELARQTDIARKACKGDWLFYLQSDEVVHEKDLEIIKNRCAEFQHDDEVEGLLFDYKHFWGDYDHYHNAHGWYPSEIRVIKNRPDIRPWRDAQSFRKIQDFKEGDWHEYYRKEGTEKLKVVRAGADIYHYGWVRPPEVMTSKKVNHDSLHHGSDKGQVMNQATPLEFDYGPLNKLPVFHGSHPVAMKDKINELYWKSSLQYKGNVRQGRNLHKHEKLKNRLTTFIEQKVLGGKQIGTFKNYCLLKKK
ncbi:glycosyltransferase family 2 protein [Cytophagaceae bacterium ABcell3]|nr:glycosyltransferase family 2 protein [Cytophagaceae bacterium ABcell3]